ncbi:MAG TPA: NAD(P)-dependent oxidoreductase [Actinocatenispora sp.]
MRLLVIGGAGYVGRLVLPVLAGRHELRVLDLHEPDTGCEYMAGDATNPADLARATAGAEAVVHMAMAPTTATGRCDPTTAFDVHVRSPYLTVQAAREARHVVFVSSLSVHGGLRHRTLAANEPADATDTYGLTKRLGEQAAAAAARETGTALTVLRLAWPTPDTSWPAWQVGLDDGPGPGRTYTEVDPDDPHPPVRMRDGRPVAALAGTDLATALLAALDRPDGIRTLPLTGDTTNTVIDMTGTWQALDWTPTHRL